MVCPLPWGHQYCQGVSAAQKGQSSPGAGNHTPSLKGEHQPTPLPHTVSAPHGAGPCSPRLPGEVSGSAHSNCGLGTAVEGFHPPSSSRDRRASKTQVDNVSNTTSSHDSTAGHLLLKEERGHVHKDGHFGVICVSWNDQCGQFHGDGQAF